MKNNEHKRVLNGKQKVSEMQPGSCLSASSVYTLKIVSNAENGGKPSQNASIILSIFLYIAIYVYGKMCVQSLSGKSVWDQS